MECDYPVAKRARFCSSETEPQSCHLAAAAMDYSAAAKEVDMQDAAAFEPDTAPQSDHSRRKNSMPVMERFFLGLLTERDLYERGIRLTQEQLSLYKRLKGGYY